MLNRRLLRVKVMQALYAFFRAPDTDIGKAQKALMHSIDKVYELYLYYLLLPTQLAHVAEIQMEEAKNKVLPNEEDLNPSRRFIDSFIIKVLNEDEEIKSKVNEYKISWSTEQDYLMKLWRQIKQSNRYTDFINTEDHPAAHRKFIETIYKEFILEDDYIYSSFQEKSIYWDFEDSDFAINMAMRFMGKIKSEEKYKLLPKIYKEEEDINFVKKLFLKTIARNEELDELIDKKTNNWEMDRIAVLDVVFMKMAIVEFMDFSSIPVKVSINEYIELSKFFSTPKSKLFINGVLDKVLAELKKENKIKKKGRGLLES